MKRVIIFASIFAFGCLSDPETSDNGKTTPTTGVTTGNNGTSNNTTQTSNTTAPKCIPETETCDQKDNDCDGDVDEELGEECCFSDADCNGTICDLEANKCIQCNDNSLCGEPNASKCGMDNTCIACETSDDCSHISGDRAQCDAGTCVVCAGDRDCLDDEKCDLEKKVCAACLSDADCGNEKCLVDVEDPTQNSCVTCVANTHCTDVSAPKCDDANACSACESNADCTHLPDTLACNAGTCVECTVDSDCPGTACDLATNTCSNQVLNSVGQCESCVSDSACKSTHSCILTEFNGNSAGQYCLEKKVTTCDQPYSSIITRASVSGAPAAAYCGVNESQVSCPAVANNGKMCREVIDINGIRDVCAGEGAVCLNPSQFVKVCRYSCSNSSECDPGVNCVNTRCES